LNPKFFAKKCVLNWDAYLNECVLKRETTVVLFRTSKELNSQTAWETNTIVLYVYYVYVCRWLRICICLLIRIMYCIRMRILQECNRLQRRLAPFFARSLFFCFFENPDNPEKISCCTCFHDHEFRLYCIYFVSFWRKK